jgi:hypothetical protein
MSTDQKHTPEPWQIFGTNTIFSAGTLVCSCETEATASRIVSCVHALAGVPDPAVFVARIADLEKLAGLYKQKNIHTTAEKNHREWMEYEVVKRKYELAAEHQKLANDTAKAAHILAQQIAELTERLGL